MNHFERDVNNDEILLSSTQEQIMMEWEKPYMEASIDFLEPKGRVLEVGFGCGYSASQIMKYKPKSYTVIECDPIVIEKIKIWKENFPDIKIHIVEGMWQEKLHILGVFDEIYFDDYPLDISKESSQMEMAVSMKRLNIFVDLCIRNHTKVGSKICFYSNGNSQINLGSDSEPFIEKKQKDIEVHIPVNCKYRNLKEQKCTIPLLTIIKKYSFDEAQRCAIKEINKIMAERKQTELASSFKIGC
jgi:hypothetical protein